MRQRKQQPVFADSVWLTVDVQQEGNVHPAV